MKIDIDSASAIGDVVRASRKAQKIRQRLHVTDACQLPSLDQISSTAKGAWRTCPCYQQEVEVRRLHELDSLAGWCLMCSSESHHLQHHQRVGADA